MENGLREYEFSEFKLVLFSKLDKTDISEQNNDFNIVKGNSAYAGTAVTLKNIEFLMHKFKNSGECNGGKYYWQHNMIILSEMSLDCLYESLLDIVNDPSLSLDEMFYKIT